MYHIKQMEVFIKAKDQEMFYGDEYPSLDMAWEYVSGSDTILEDAEEVKISVKWDRDFLIISDGEPMLRNVDVYNNVIIIDSSGVSDNYIINSLGSGGDPNQYAGDLEVKAKSITVTLKPQEKPFNNSNWPIEDLYDAVEVRGYLGINVVYIDENGEPQEYVGPNAGEYAITGIDASDNYDVTYIDSTFTITKATLTATITGYSGVFDDQEHGVVKLNSDGNPAIVVTSSVSNYQLTDYKVEFLVDGSYTETVPTVKHVSDSETISYRIIDSYDNHTPFSGTFDVAISAAENTIRPSTGGHGSWTYGDGDDAYDRVNDHLVNPMFTFGNNLIEHQYYVMDGDNLIEYNGSIDASTPAGSYKVKVWVDADSEHGDQPDYGYSEAMFEFTVYKRPLNVYWQNPTLQHDSGSELTNTLIGFDAEKMDYINEQPDYSTVVVNGSVLTMAATDGGTYSLILTIKDDFMSNYCWSDENAEFVRVIWTISLQADGWIKLAIDGWNYGSAPSEPIAVAESGRAATISYRYANGGAVSGTPTEAGSYIMVAEIGGDDDYGYLYGECRFTIEKLNITKPSDSTYAGYVYTGSEIEFNLDNETWFNNLTEQEQNIFKTHVDSSGGVETDAGTGYEITFYLKDTNNCIWTDGTADPIDVSWSIAKMILPHGAVDGFEYEYDGGNPISLDLSEVGWFDSDIMYLDRGVDGTVTANVVNEYWAYVVISNANYAWAYEGGVAVTSLKVNWAIIPDEVELPSFVIGADESVVKKTELHLQTKTNYDGTGEVPTLVFTGFNTTNMEIEVTSNNGYVPPIQFNTATREPFISTTIPGMYTITITIQENMHWVQQQAQIMTLGADEQESIIDKIVYVFIVTGEIDIPVGYDSEHVEELEYTGSEQSFIPVWFNPDTMRIEGTCSGRDVGDEVTYKVYPGNYYSWKGEGDSAVDYLEVSWKIVPKIVKVYWSEDTFIYNGKNQKDGVTAYFINLDDQLVSLNVDSSGIFQNVSDTVVFTVSLPDEYSTNFVIAESDKTNSGYKISPLPIEIVVESITMQYGATPEYRWHFNGTGFLEKEYELNVTATNYSGNVGSYELEIGYKGIELSNYAISPVLGTLTVVAKEIDFPDTITFQFDGETHDIIQNLETEFYGVVGTTDSSEVGSYTVVLSLVDKINYVWSDTKDVLDRELTWYIVSGKPIDESMFTINLSPETYTGSAITKAVSSEELVLGQDYVVSYVGNINAGTATITVSGIGGYGGSFSKTFEIVPAKPAVSFYNVSLRMYVEDDSFYNAVKLPSYIPDNVLRYTSSDESIATVDPSSGAIVMNKTGTVTITVTVPETDNYASATATYELTVSDHPVEVVDHVVYVKVPVEVPDGDDDDDQTDDKPETVYIEKDNDLYIWLLIVMAVICVCFAAYILYTHRDQEGGA